MFRIPSDSLIGPKNQSYLAPSEHLSVALRVASRRLTVKVESRQVVRLPLGEG